MSDKTTNPKPVRQARAAGSSKLTSTERALLRRLERTANDEGTIQADAML